MVPTRKECLDLIRQHQMLPHILQHSKLVTRIALLIAGKLNRAGLNLDLALVEAAALLHDIAKTRSIETNENHAHTGGKLLTSLGYPAVANIVRQHIRLDSGSAASANSKIVTEEELVNYADKRAKHEEVVDLSERFRDIEQRYAKKISSLGIQLQEVFVETQVIEKKIFSILSINPEDIEDILFFLPNGEISGREKTQGNEKVPLHEGRKL